MELLQPLALLVSLVSIQEEQLRVKTRGVSMIIVHPIRYGDDSM